MKITVKDLIDQLSKFPPDLVVVGLYSEYHPCAGKGESTITDDIELYERELFKTNGFYDYETYTSGGKLTPYTKERVLIIEL